MDTNNAYITKHAKERLKQRCGFNKKASEKMVQKAYEEGITHSETKGNLNKWITGVFFHTKKANNIRIYGDKAYLFHDTTLITVLQVPPSIMKNMKNMIKRPDNTLEKNNLHKIEK